MLVMTKTNYFLIILFLPANNDIIRDILHDGSRLPCHQSQQHWSFVQVPEEEEFTTRCSGAADMSKQVAGVVPEDTVETENNFVEITIT